MSAANTLLAGLLLCACLSAQESNDQAPSFSSDSIVNSADNRAASLAPNVLATIYGKNLSFSTATAPLGLSAADLPRLLGNVRVDVGSVAANVLYVSPSQINFLIPASLRAGTVTVVVVRQSTSAQASVVLHDVAPAIFLMESGLPAVTHLDGSLVTMESPARPGEIVTAWGAGLGITTPKQGDGTIPRAAAWLAAPDSFRIALGSDTFSGSKILYVGVAPGFPGLYQVNLRLPDVILDSKPEFRIGFEGQMSQGGVILPVAPSEP